MWSSLGHGLWDQPCFGNVADWLIYDAQAGFTVLTLYGHVVGFWWHCLSN